MKKSKIEHTLSRKIGMAINKYGMIEAGDNVLVAVSGGKDSLTMLKLLFDRKKWLPIDYNIKAVHVITDYENNTDKKKQVLERFFKDLDCDYIIKEVKIAETNKLDREDCFWCSWNRRKVIFQAAEELGCNKVALGHHKDDVIETILMNMIWTGEMSSINPVQSLFEGKITLIRPLVLLEESEIKDYAKETGLVSVGYDCPRNLDSKRKLIKTFIKDLAEENQDIKSNILRAIHRVKIEYISNIEDAE